MDHYKIISDFHKGKPSGELYCSLDFDLNWIKGLPDEIKEWKDVQNGLGFVFPAGLKGHFYRVEYNDCISYSKSVQENGIIEKWDCPEGSLQTRIANNHPVEHAVKNGSDCRILKCIYENMRYVPNYEFSSEINYTHIYTATSPVQRLLQYEMGLENFYSVLMNNKKSLEELMEVMQDKVLELTELACGYGIDTIYQSENTSTTMISPDYYKELSLPQIRKHADLVHSKEKKIVLHMCGHLKNLLTMIKQTGIDGIHSLTPPPIGDTPFDEVYQLFGKNFPIYGRFGSTQWHGLGEDQIIQNLEEILPKGYWKDKAFILLVTVDGLQVQWQELKKLSNLLQNYGKS